MDVGKRSRSPKSNANWSPATVLLYRVTTIALNGGCLGSGIDEDRS